MNREASLQGRIAELRVRFHRNPQSHLFAPLADLLRQAGEYEEALLLLEDGLVRCPQYGSAMIVLGQTLFDTGRSGHGRRVLQRVLEQDPENLVALRALAVDAVDQEDLVAAVPLLEQLVSLEPEDTHWNRTLVRCRGDLARPAQSMPTEEPAAPEVDATVALEPDDQGDTGDGTLATMTLVDIYLAQGYRTRALDALRRMAERYPDRKDIQTKLVEVECLVAPGEAPPVKRPAPPNGKPRREMEKQQFQSWLDCLNPEEDRSP